MKTRVNKLKVNNFKYHHNGEYFVLYDIDKYKLIKKGLLVIDRCLTKEQFISAINWFNNLNNFGHDNLWIDSGELKEQNVINILLQKIMLKSIYFDENI